VRRERDPGLIGGDVLDQDQDAAALPQVWCGRLGEEERPFRGHAGGGVPVGFRHLLDRLRREPVRRRLDDQVEAAEPVDRGCDELARAGDRREVAVHASGGDDPPAFGLKPHRDRTAHSARSARDERPLVAHL